MEWVDRILLFLAFASFLVAAFDAATVRRVNLVALGLMFWVLVSLLHALGVEH